jgi:hypothetical protein
MRGKRKKRFGIYAKPGFTEPAVFPGWRPFRTVSVGFLKIVIYCFRYARPDIGFVGTPGPATCRQGPLVTCEVT